MTYDDGKNRPNFWAKAFFAALGSVLGVVLSAGGASAGSAVSETMLYSFCQQTNCADGKNPTAGLIATTQGALYGTTLNGGNANLGVMFVVSVTGVYNLVHPFQGGLNDGATPNAPLYRDMSGNFYGTTSAGGATGVGTVFKRSTNGVYSLRHAFTSTDGAAPSAGVIADSAGNLYGTTSGGGANNAGTIFRLTPGGTLTTLYSFCSMTGCSGGRYPTAGLIADASGNLYGTTQYGGVCSSCGGVVFKIHADGTGYTVLHSFMGGDSDGLVPSGLTADASGNLYGTTQGGGNSGCGFDGIFGCGTVFKLGPDGFAVLFKFCDPLFCADGSGNLPMNGVILDADGNLYGTAEQGGANNSGTVFSLTPSGTFTVLYSFCSLARCADGSFPNGNLAALGNGNLYGTTQDGGTNNAGTVYQLTNTGFVP